MSKYTGLVFAEKNPSFDYNEIEKLLGFDDCSIAGVYWEVEVSVSGKDTPATHWQPAEYEEIDDVTVTDTIFEMYEGRDITANKTQADILETYRPVDDEVYWDIVGAERKLGADDEGC